ncbi:tetrapyrrole biosynthesis, uroporphyrinogen III synthase [Cantharellus anzutake]|uniref:tetrapyrrole biosynthesis, uroporphyrinogen III synthase n=1 Tax=Cantharellus anzutake TaxID=1750568 RepID=UPI001905D90D|nr:tetrapyrrole biosynthesis, uroporphyrinogen III synthase [Cantharellus anzutake]KAF8335864.1 tetrapyrrole biosynthesis, uroporphyrinogen III synthase [Cantharellus anzutake]
MSALPTSSGDVILFRSRDGDSATDSDPYEDSLKSCGYSPWFVPVLQHSPVNGGVLRQLLLDGPQHRFGAVIVTSGRAAERWLECAAILDANGSKSAESVVCWSDLPFYVIGVRTESLLKHKHILPFTSSFIPKLTLGAESGTGSKLAEFIIHDYPSRSQLSRCVSLPLLYLVGDKTTGELASHLKSAGLHAHPLQVYQTWARNDFDEDIRIIMKSGESSETPNDNSADRTHCCEVPKWIVFFAPSSARAVLPTLRQYFKLHELGDEAQERRSHVRVAAIGSTTASYLKTVESLAVHVIPSNPRAQDLVEAISAYNRNH